jgi:hypothetical protein
MYGQGAAKSKTASRTANALQELIVADLPLETPGEM